MKTSLDSILITLAAGFAGVAAAQLGNTPFVASLRGDVLGAIVFSGGMLSLAVYDYTRRLQLLAIANPALRPPLPAGHPSAGARLIRREKALVEKVAA